MRMFWQLFSAHYWQLSLVFILTILFGLSGIALLMFINSYLLTLTHYDPQILLVFIGLLLLFLLLSVFSQFGLTALGHHFVYLMRKQLIKQILDSDVAHLQQLGKAQLLASLSTDIRNLSFAFVRLPELLQGMIFVGCAAVYMAWLSMPLFLISLLWIVCTLWIGHLAISKVHREIHQIRLIEDKIYGDYQSAIEGHRELKLNRKRAEDFFTQELEIHSQQQKRHYIIADFFHFFANNWTNVMLLGAVGLNFYLALGQQITDLQTATTLALTILFLRTPLINAIGAIPNILAGQVALRKLSSLKLATYQPHFQHENKIKKDWQCIRFQQVSYAYNQTGKQREFTLQPLDLTIKRGETIFLIGKNGSGKSTFSMLLAGLYQPISGKIFVDQQEITLTDWDNYRQQISAVFSDFYLFSKLLGKKGDRADDHDVAQWLEQLQLTDKVEVIEQQLSTTHLSQGQRKRLALLLALLEERPLLILDEWAADQDPSFRRIFYRELLPRLKQRGQTIFAISHDDAYFDVADRVLLAQQGRLRELNSVERKMASYDMVEKF